MLGEPQHNHPQLLYETDSMVISLCTSMDGRFLISGHLDGSVYRFMFGDGVSTQAYHERIVVHPCPPQSLSWGDDIVVAGGDCRVRWSDLFLRPALCLCFCVFPPHNSSLCLYEGVFSLLIVVWRLL